MSVTWSIRRRLLSRLIGGIVLACAVATLGLYVSARHEVDELFDRELKQVALSLRTQQDLDVTQSELDPDTEDEDAIVVIARDRNGRHIFGPAADVPALVDPTPGYADAIWSGERWRYYAASGSAGTVIAAQPLAARARMALGAVLRILVPMLGLMLALVVLVWVTVGRGLRPLTQIADQLSVRTASALLPINAEHAPLEIMPFIAALNQLLHRLRQELSKQTHFLADATHELRTPLAALKLQLDLVQSATSETERNGALIGLRSGLERIIHLSQQLLTIARVDSQPLGPAALRTDLSQVAMGVVTELWSLAKARDIDLGIVSNEPAGVAADAEAMRILLVNIVDNAIRYTPRGGKIDVSLRRERRSAILQVTDTGPGIPAHERERVFDRFYRGIGQTTPGSGLGLAIVKGIAQRYGAQVTLADGDGHRGLRVRVALPWSEAPPESSRLTRPPAMASDPTTI